jgi:hypothetical protein
MGAREGGGGGGVRRVRGGSRAARAAPRPRIDAPTPISFAISSIHSSTSDSSWPAAAFFRRALMRFFISALGILTFCAILITLPAASVYSSAASFSLIFSSFVHDSPDTLRRPPSTSHVSEQMALANSALCVMSSTPPAKSLIAIEKAPSESRSR